MKQLVVKSVFIAQMFLSQSIEALIDKLVLLQSHYLLHTFSVYFHVFSIYKCI